MPPTPPKALAASTDEPVIGIKVDGITYLFYPDRVSSRIENSLVMQAEGQSLTNIYDAMKKGSASLPVVAAFVFLARLQAGDDVRFDDVADAITYRSDVSLFNPTEDGATPKAPDAS